MLQTSLHTRDKISQTFPSVFPHWNQSSDKGLGMRLSSVDYVWTVHRCIHISSSMSYILRYTVCAYLILLDVLHSRIMRQNVSVVGAHIYLWFASPLPTITSIPLEPGTLHHHAAIQFPMYYKACYLSSFSPLASNRVMCHSNMVISCQFQRMSHKIHATHVNSIIPQEINSSMNRTNTLHANKSKFIENHWYKNVLASSGAFSWSKIQATYWTAHTHLLQEFLEQSTLPR